MAITLARFIHDKGSCNITCIQILIRLLKIIKKTLGQDYYSVKSDVVVGHFLVEMDLCILKWVETLAERGTRSYRFKRTPNSFLMHITSQSLYSNIWLE
ncbi:hypothetical protein Hanom_Chr05g00419641 [Helianthus anomalus]